MPQPIERVVSERQSNSDLGQDLQSQRPGGEAGGHDGALEVPADARGDEVEGSEGVEGAREGHARHAVERGTVPGYLRLVDAEVRRDGAVQALLREDGVRGLGRGHGLGGGVSVVGGPVVSGLERVGGHWCGSRARAF